MAQLGLDHEAMERRLDQLRTERQAAGMSREDTQTLLERIRQRAQRIFFEYDMYGLRSTEEIVADAIQSETPQYQPDALSPPHPIIQGMSEADVDGIINGVRPLVKTWGRRLCQYKQPDRSPVAA